MGLFKHFQRWNIFSGRDLGPAVARFFLKNAMVDIDEIQAAAIQTVWLQVEGPASRPGAPRRMRICGACQLCAKQHTRQRCRKTRNLFCRKPFALVTTRFDQIQEHPAAVPIRICANQRAVDGEVRRAACGTQALWRPTRAIKPGPSANAVLTGIRIIPLRRRAGRVCQQRANPCGGR